MSNVLIIRIKSFVPVGATKLNIPLNVFVQEADDIYVWCQEDREALTHVGLDWTSVELIPECARVCREFQSQWQKKLKTTSTLKKDWNKVASEAKNLHADLLHDYSFAFRKDAQLLVKLKDMSSVSSQAKLVQALNDMAALADGQNQLLNVIHFNYANLERAKELVPLLADLIARMENSKKQKDETKEMRDKSYVFLKTIIDELKETAKYCFRKNPERLAGYLSDYWAKKNMQRTTSNSNSTDTDTKSEN